MQKLGKIFVNIILFFLGAAALGIVVPNLLGISTMAVLSGSMEPAYATGSLVYVVPTEAEEIKEGDVISFILNSQGIVVTHRVVEVDKNNERFYVKGDANQSKDANPVQFSNVLGVVRFCVPMMGYALSYLLTVGGKIIAGTVIIALILMTMLFDGDGEKEQLEELSENDRVSRQRRNNRYAAEYVAKKRHATMYTAKKNVSKEYSAKRKTKNEKNVYSKQNRYVPRYR